MIREGVRGSAKVQQLVDGNPRFVQDLAQSSRTDVLVIRDYDTAVNDKAHANKHPHEFLTGKVRVGNFTECRS